MSELSVELLRVTILLYLAAAACHLVEYAFGPRGAVARTADRPANQRELVGAGGPPVAVPVSPAPVPTATPPDPPGVKPGRSRAVSFGRAGVALTVLAVVVHIGVLVTRGVAAGRVPWGNMYEFVIAVTLV